MIKNLFLTIPVALVITSIGGCASTEMEKRLEKNFVYQCSLQLFDKLDKKVTGADAEKICAAAHKAEQDEEAHKNSGTTAAPTSTPAAQATPTPAEEIKPEPTPKK